MSLICVSGSHDFTTRSWPLNLRCNCRATDTSRGSDRGCQVSGAAAALR